VAYERILRRFRQCVREREYLVTLHAEEEMSADALPSWMWSAQCGGIFWSSRTSS